MQIEGWGGGGRGGQGERRGGGSWIMNWSGRGRGGGEKGGSGCRGQGRVGGKQKRCTKEVNEDGGRHGGE